MTTDTNRVIRATHRELRSGSSRARRVLLHFLELQVPMAIGAFICLMVIRLIPPSSGLAAVYHPNTYLFAIGDMFFLTVPVVIWMTNRGYGRRQSAEMALAMLVPLLAIVALGELAGYAYLPWLTVVGYPALSLGMLGYLLGPMSHRVNGAT
jgi:hypothetical protein